MGDTTPRWDFPYPVGSDPTNIPGDMNAFADAIDDVMMGAEALSSLPAAGLLGRVVRRTSDDTYWIDNGSSWDPLPTLNTDDGEISRLVPGESSSAGASGKAAAADHVHGLSSILTTHSAVLGADVELGTSDTTIMTLSGLTPGMWLVLFNACLDVDGAGVVGHAVVKAVPSAGATILGPTACAVYMNETSSSDGTPASLAVLVNVTTTASVTFTGKRGSNPVRATATDSFVFGDSDPATGYVAVKVG
jgi:hypothetical protein